MGAQNLSKVSMTCKPESICIFYFNRFFPTMDMFFLLADTESDCVMSSRNDLRIFCLSKPPVSA